MTSFTKTLLYADVDGRSRFKEEAIELDHGRLNLSMSRWELCKAYCFRHSPIGYVSDFHTTIFPSWVIVLQGEMEVALHDGAFRRFAAGDCFYAGDILPEGQTFDQAVHGHRSKQLGPVPLVTIFVST